MMGTGQAVGAQHADAIETGVGAVGALGG